MGMIAKCSMAALVASLASWACPAHAADPVDTLRAVNAEYDKALVNADVAALRRIYSQDFTYTTPDGVLRSKAEQLAFVEAGRLGLISGSSDDVRVRVYGDFAVITGRFKGVLRDTSGKVEFRERYTTAWLRRRGQWVLLAEQGNIIKGPAVER